MKIVKKALFLLLCLLQISVLSGFLWFHSTPAEPTAEETKPPSIEEQISAEGGVIAYAYPAVNNGISPEYVIIDTNKKELTKIISIKTSTDTYTGNLVNGIEAGSYSYKLTNRDSLEKLNVFFLGGGRGNKVEVFNKVPLETAENGRAYFEGWYERHNQRFKGRLVRLGNYETDGNKDNGPEPVEWIILHEESGKSLLLSSFLLTHRNYNDTPDEDGTYSWKKSNLRKWLNGDFYNEVFSSDEKKHILNTKMTLRGVTTKDKVVLLSYEQVQDYFSETKLPRTAGGTEAAGGGRYWRRTMTDWWTISCKDVMIKYFVDRDGRLDTEYAFEKLGIRPAIWIDSSYAETLKDNAR